MVWIACITISSTSKPSSRKNPRSCATKKGMDVVLLAAKPMRTRVKPPAPLAEKPSSVMQDSRKRVSKKSSVICNVFFIVTSFADVNSLNCLKRLEPLERFDQLELLEPFEPFDSQRGGSGPAPTSFLKFSTTSGSRGISLTAFSCASGRSGDGSSPVSFLYS